MKKRTAVLLLLLILITLMSVPASRQIMAGLLRNEGFHEWKPTSYWIDRLEEPADREAALEALPHLGASAGQSVVIELGREHARQEGAGKQPTAVDRALDLLGIQQHERPANFRDSLREAIQRIGPQAGPVFVRAATHQDPARRRAAMEALGIIGRKYADAIPALGRGLRDEDPAVQRAAIESLEKIGRKAKAAVPALIEALPRLGQDDADHALNALVSMGRSARPAAPVFVAMLDDPDPARRAAAVCCLARIGGLTGDVLPKICALLDDKTLTDREIYRDILRNLEPAHPVMVPTLLRALQDDQLSYYARTALSNFGSHGKQAVPALMEHLRADDAEIRKAVADALARIGPDARPSLPRLKEMLLHDKEVLVRLAAARAMWHIDQDAAAVEAIRKMLEDEDVSVRLSAATDLWRIDKEAEAVVATIVKALEELKDPEPGFEQMFRPTDVEGVNTPVCRRSRLIGTCAWLVERVGAQALAAEAGLLDANLDRYPGGKDAVFQALGAIGPKATRSIPVLVAAVEKQNNVHAALALWKITGDTSRTMPCLVGAVERASTLKAAAGKSQRFRLDFEEREAQWGRQRQAEKACEEALACLAEMGRHAREAVPAVTKRFRVKTEFMSDRFRAAKTLVKLGDVSDELFHFLVELVEEEEAGIYVYIACSLLAEMEPRTAEAIPILQAARQDDDERIAKAAAEALKEIESRAAKR